MFFPSISQFFKFKITYMLAFNLHSIVMKKYPIHVPKNGVNHTTLLSKGCVVELNFYHVVLSVIIYTKHWGKELLNQS